MASTEAGGRVQDFSPPGGVTGPGDGRVSKPEKASLSPKVKPLHAARLTYCAAAAARPRPRRRLHNPSEVDDSRRADLIKLQRAVLLAAADMDQAAAAARALETEQDGNLARALETAMAVCYMRAFTKSSMGTLPDKYVPRTSPEAEQHASLKRLRDKTYAHTDKASGRNTTSSTVEPSGAGVITVVWQEQWLPFPRQLLPAVVDYLMRRGNAFRSDAADIQLELDGYRGGLGADGETYSA